MKKQSLVDHRDEFLREHEQVRAAPALQLNFLQLATGRVRP